MCAIKRLRFGAASVRSLNATLFRPEPPGAEVSALIKVWLFCTSRLLLHIGPDRLRPAVSVSLHRDRLQFPPRRGRSIVVT